MEEGEDTRRNSVGTRLGNKLTRVVERIADDTKTRDELILEMHAVGIPYSEIGQYARLSKAGVRYVLERHGVLNGN
jgi:hypothetical protein